MPRQAGPRESRRAGQEGERREAKAQATVFAEAGKARGRGRLRMGWLECLWSLGCRGPLLGTWL